jgi:flagellar biosynthetic protein FlhB
MGENRTEKATPRRRQKAREEGQVLRSRELSASLALLTLVMVLAWQPLLSWRDQWRALWCNLLTLAVSGDLQSPLPALRQVALMAARWTLPAVCAATGVSALASIAQGGVNFSTKGLMPKLSRLSPASNLGRVFSLGGVSSALKALVPLAFITYLCSGIVARDWTQMTLAGHAAPIAAAAWILSRLFEVSWKASLIFLAWSGLDYMLQKFSYERSLRMTKEEIRQEGKDTEGNPQNKRRIRKMQFKLRRRFRMADVARATVLVTNPTHYAVALEYRPESMAAPLVIAKGRNVLAQQIKQYALWHDVPVVENKPLAQALYKAVEVGQAIPERLYTAVAEILAFLFRAQQRRLSPQLLRRERA